MEPDPIEPHIDHLTVVDQSEFNLLAMLLDYQRNGDSLIRMEGDHVFVTMLQSAHTHLERLTLEVDAECAYLDEPSLPPIPELPIVPPQPKSDGVPKADVDAWSRMGMDKPPPEHETGRDRPRGNGMGFGGL